MAEKDMNQNMKTDILKNLKKKISERDLKEIEDLGRAKMWIYFMKTEMLKRGNNMSSEEVEGMKENKLNMIQMK